MTNSKNEGHAKGLGGMHLTGLRARQFWLPHSVRLVVARAASIINTHQSFARNTLSLPINLAHHVRRANSFQWTRLPFDFLTETQMPDRMSNTNQTDRERASADGSVSIEKDTSLVNQREAPASPLRSSVRDQRPHVVFARRESRLSSFRPIINATRSNSDSFAAPAGTVTPVSKPWRPISLTFEKDQVVVENSGAATSLISARRFEPVNSEPHQPTFRPLLNLSVSSAVRRELPGGFPTNRTSITETYATQPAIEILPSQRDALVEQVRPVTTLYRLPPEQSQSLSVLERVSESRGAIEKLIERSVMPVPLPGLELRLFAPPEKQPSDSDWTREAGGSRHEEANTQVDSHTITPLPPQPTQPPVNINEVADKVYQTLMRRQQLERERKGLY